MSGHTWQELYDGPHGDLVRDLRKIVAKGIGKFDAAELESLPILFGMNGQPADTPTVRAAIVAVLMARDPSCSPATDAAGLSVATNVRLALFRATGALREANIATARAAVGAHIRPGLHPIAADGIRRPGGREWYLLKELSEEIAELAGTGRLTEADADASATASAGRVDRRSVQVLYHAPAPGDSEKGFWWRASTAAYIRELAALTDVTIFAGADGPSDVGPPLHAELLVNVLVAELPRSHVFASRQKESASQTAAEVVSALSLVCTPAQIGSMIRELRSLRRGTTRSLETLLYHSIQTEIARRRSTSGFVASAITLLALTWRLRGRAVEIISTHFDSDIWASVSLVRDRHPGLQDIVLRDVDDGVPPDDVPDGVVPFMRIHGSPGDNSAQPLVVGEADFFSDQPVWATHSRSHVPRATLVKRALDRGDVLFVGTSLTEPGLVSVLATTRDPQRRRYALLVPPDLTQTGLGPRETPAEYSLALTVLAQRYLHLGVVPIMVDFEQQVPQFLREIAGQVDLGADYVPYESRLGKWWGRLAPLVGYDSTGNQVSPANRELRSRWRRRLRTIRQQIEEFTDLGPSSGGETIRLEAWLRNHKARSLFRFATSDHRERPGSAAEVRLLDYGVGDVVQRAFRQGRALAESVDGGRWSYVIAVHLVLHASPWHHLPVGVVTVKSNRASGRVQALGEDSDALGDLEASINQSLTSLLDLSYTGP